MRLRFWEPPRIGAGEGASWSWMFSALGGLASAMAVVSLVQKWFDVGIAPILSEILKAYRGLIHPIAGVFLSWLHWFWPNWQIPGWVKDLWALSMLGGAMLARHEANRDRFEYPARPDYERAIFTILITIIYGLLLIGLLVMVLFPFIFAFFAISRYMRNYDIEGPELDRDLVIGFFTGLGGAILFFIVNWRL